MKTAPFVGTGTGVHPTLDLEALLRWFPDFPLDVWNITSPSDLIAWEVMRDRYGIRDPNHEIACDLFVWGTGEPPDRRLTRVGGVPWLPKRTPWPEIGGVVTTFLCQFDFRDSRDLSGQRVGGQLPGDLLLVFVADEDSALSGDKEEMRFLWVSANESDVITAADVPEPTHPFDFVTAWGVRYRTADVPTKWEQAYRIPEDVGEGSCWKLPVLWGTKIGGVPYDSQSNLDEVPPGYLCQLTSIQACDTAWPWVDRETPLGQKPGDGGVHAANNCLMIGDMGELTLFLSDTGELRVDSCCG